MLSNKKVVLGITGGIAAYKSCYVVRHLIKEGTTVEVIMTRAAQEFITPITLEALSGKPVTTEMFGTHRSFGTHHIESVQKADLFVIAPATANIIAKVSCGVCDDLLSTTLCACWDKAVLIAPAMNSNMWANPIVQRNMTILTDQLKFKTIGPEQGRLACGTTGIGRMAEPGDILEALSEALK